jgi:hypothetical protein
MDKKTYIMEKLKGFNIPINNDQSTIILICAIKNEYLLLEYFLKYYMDIGITHFIFIDNNSSDDSVNYLLNHSANIMLFRTEEPFRNNKAIWVTNILNEYCKNKWCLTVDADEIVYNNNLNILKNYMEKKAANVCKFYLLDMYPKNYDIDYKKGEPFLNHSYYYDKESIINKDWCSGVRKRCMNVDAWLQKVSFFKYTFSCCHIVNQGFHELHNISNHTCIKYFNDIQILLHFKFIKPNLIEFFNDCVKNNQYWQNSKEYKEYLKTNNYNFFNPKYSLSIKDTKPLFTFLKDNSFEIHRRSIMFNNINKFKKL